MNTSHPSVLLVVLACGAAFSATAPMPAPGPAGLNAAMTQLFGDFTAFSARAEVRLKDKARKDTLSMGMDFAVLDGKMRADIDLAQIKSKDMSPETVASLKQLGMDKMVTIVRPDRKSTLVVYPALRAYAEAPMSKQDSEDLARTYKVEKTKLGTERVDGHPCDQYRVTVTSEKGDRHEALVWYAADVKGFPIQMQLNQPEATVLMLYRNIKLDRPPGRDFEAPVGFSKHTSVENLMQEAMMKMMGGTAK